ncbi:MAG: hypothetical protein VX738_14960 [Planctomycetota bacterium]|nr:hypothetical protein [Planctomycetota bacterium]
MTKTSHHYFFNRRIGVCAVSLVILALSVSSGFAVDKPAPARIQFIAYQDSNLGEPGFDPYANSGAPRPPTFDQNGEGLGTPPDKPWFGPAYTAPKDPPAQSLFGGSLFNRNIDSSAADLFRFAETPRFQYAWIPDGSSNSSVSLGELDASIVFAFPNFLASEQPIYVAPTFSLTTLSGPRTKDLPGQTYSGYLDMLWTSDPQQRLYMDLGVTIGVHTDFDTFTTDSLRITGHALTNLAITEETTIRFGIVYFDRVDIKLLPAVGIFWNPNEDTRFDLFFPRPRLSQYFTTLNNYDVWWYVGGEYGGGSWTVKRTSGVSNQVDINDLRITTGFEFGLPEQLREGRHIGFIEAGIVFDRKVIYKNNPADNLSPGSTIMLRAGIGY